MDNFTADYLANLTADLTMHALAAAGKRLREAVQGTEKEQAIHRCFGAGVVALLATATTALPAEMDLLADIFGEFLRDEDVGRELAVLLRGDALKLEELEYLFAEAGYEAERLSGLDFAQGMRAFEAAFIATAEVEESLQSTIQTHQLLTQTSLQRELLDAMRQLVTFLRQAHAESVTIGRGQITALAGVGGGRPVVYTLPQALPTLPDWESHYLRTLVSRCDPLDLTVIDESYPQGEQTDPVRLSDIFTTLYLEGLTRRPRQTVAEAMRRQGQDAAESHGISGRNREESLPIQALEAVAAVPRLVILGRPGGGKSTLINHLVTQLARRRLGEGAGTRRCPVGLRTLLLCLCVLCCASLPPGSQMRYTRAMPGWCGPIWNICWPNGAAGMRTPGCNRHC